MSTYGVPKTRAWQRMLSGRRLDLLAPSASDIEIEDIAHGLARLARWNGQTMGPHAFTVAQHSLTVVDIFKAKNPGRSAKDVLAALLHDAPEYVIGDLISPFKAAIGLDYKAFEQRLLAAIHARFGLDPPTDSLWRAIKAADTIAAYYEAKVLAGFSAAEAAQFFGNPAVEADLDRYLSALEPWPADEAQKRFLAAFGAVARR